MSSAFQSARPWIVLVGGFLGAGKTTLLLAVTKELTRLGVRSAVIFNDQGDALVDTSLAELHGLTSAEVTGGCFCCRFSDLMDGLQALRKHAPHVIFAEPVGSCTDLSATILGPLREYAETYQLAPYTVLVDPMRAKELLREDADPHLSFLFKKQLDEADLVCFTKADIFPDTPPISTQDVRQISAKTGAGVVPWLDEVLSGTLSVGGTILDIDYEQYAQAEAALAWLNLHATLRSRESVSAAAILGPLLDRLDHAYTAAGVFIVHLKGITSSPTGYLKAATCGNGQSPVLEGAVDFSTCSEYDLLLNLRAVGDAETVRRLTEEELSRFSGIVENLTISCFHPLPPVPERRISALV